MTIPLADPLPQPAPPLLVWAFLQLTFLLHVLAMNLTLGGALLALHWRFARGRADAVPRAQLLELFTRALPILIAATVTLGVAPLLFLQVLYGRVFFTSAILMGWFWLAIVPLVIVAYAAAYGIAFGDRGRARSWLAALAALAFLAVAFLQVTNATRGLRPGTFRDVYRREPRGLTLNLDDPTLWPRYAHVLLGAVALAALAVALLGAARRRKDAAFAAWAVRHGLTLFGVATGLNAFVGLLFLVALPRDVLARLAGGDAHAMGLLAVGILLGVAAAGAPLFALGARNPGPACAALAALVAPTLAVMLLLREEIRRIVLRDAGFAQETPVSPQWGAFALFIACLVLGALAILWMVRALARGRRAPSGPAGLPA